MNKNVLGIDLGTSSVKILQLFEDGKIIKSRAEYENISPEGWWNGICQALSKLELEGVVAISLSSQVGTYIVNDTEVISWNSRIGTEEVQEIKRKYEPEVFLREISMGHPNIVSYPIPRIKYIKAKFDKRMEFIKVLENIESELDKTIEECRNGKDETREGRR